MYGSSHHPSYHFMTNLTIFNRSGEYGSTAYVTFKEPYSLETAVLLSVSFFGSSIFQSRCLDQFFFNACLIPITNSFLPNYKFFNSSFWVLHLSILNLFTQMITDHGPGLPYSALNYAVELWFHNGEILEIYNCYH